MATVEIEASASAYVYGLDFGYSYTAARATADGHATTGDFNVGQYYDDMSGVFYVTRGFLKFDTSSLSGATITQVNLSMAVSSDSSTNADFDVQIVKQNWSSQDPIASGTREAAYDGCLSGTADSNIWRNTSGISQDTVYESGNLDTTWINTSGSTYYSLRSSRDYSNTAPPYTFPSNEHVYFYNYAAATAAYRPILIVTTEGGGGGSSTPIHLIRTGMQPGMRIGL